MRVLGAAVAAEAAAAAGGVGVTRNPRAADIARGYVCP